VAPLTTRVELGHVEYESRMHRGPQFLEREYDRGRRENLDILEANLGQSGCGVGKKKEGAAPRLLDLFGKASGWSRANVH